MVRDNRYSLRARNEVDDNNLKNKLNNKKYIGNYSTRKPDVSNLRRSGGETSVPGQSTPSPLSTRKPKCLENETTPSNSPGTRKSERLVRHKTPSPLSKLDKGKKTLSSSSSGHKKPAKELNLSEEKSTKEKDVIQVTMESEKAEFQLESGRKRKKMSAHNFRRMFKVQCDRAVVLISDDESTEGADELSMDAIVTDKVVDGPSGEDGVKDSQTGPSLKEALSDHHERRATTSLSIMNVDSIDLKRSNSLPRLQDGTVHSEIGQKCPDPKDINGLVDGSAKVSMDTIVMEKVVNCPSGEDGVKASQTGLSLEEVLSDHERGAINSPSVMDVDSVDLERSTSLRRPQDGTVHSEIGEKCPDPKDTNGLMDGPETLSVDPTIMDNVVDQPPDGDGLKESRTSLCENMLPTNSSPIKNVDSLEKKIEVCFARLENGAISENGDNCIQPEDATPSPENNNEGLSEICSICSKRKRVSSGSPDNDLCSCGASVNVDLGRPSTCKDGGDQEAAVILESAECRNNGNLLKELHSDHLMDDCENVCAKGNGGEILCNKNLRPIADKGTSRFLEYWLPVQISNHQLEQYCAMLLSNSISLCSCTKNDRVGALRETLQNFRKCCDHPYLLDLSFQQRLIQKERHQAEEVLDIGIKASGKIELLDMMLTEIKNRGSQVLILFQSIRGEKASNGEILAEFLHKRFGEDSYEHVEVPSSKKQAAVNRFNKKEKGVFVFLLETRACSSAIKLLSLDNIFIYHSDWNPLNDLKALQKMSIGSKLEQIKVFRLYSSFTLEERSLILAKQNVNTENSLQTSSRAIIDNLLMWGASHLFSKLNDYHAESTSLNVSTQQSFLTEVIGEFRSILSESRESSGQTSVIAKVYKLDGGGYKSNIPLLGQKKNIVEEGQEFNVFWRNLLNRKTPRWKLLGEPCSRSRKRVQYFDGSPSKPDAVNGDVGNKRRKAANENVDPVPVQVELKGTEVTDPKEGSSTTCNQPQSLQNNGVTETSNLNANQTCNALESAETTALSDQQKSLHSSLLAEMMKLCHILKFSEDVTDNARRFLEYIIKNHHVSSDSPAILHAFQISLCWITASISKQKVDKKDSLLLAKQHLNYQCTEEYAQSVYLKMRSLKRMYLSKHDVNREPHTVDEGGANVASSKLLEVKKETVENPANEEHETDSKISKIQKICLKRQKKLLCKQQEKIQEFNRIWEEKKRNLEKDHQLATSLIRTLYGQGSTRAEELKRLEDGLEMKMKEHNLLMEVEFKNLEAEQVAAMNEEKQKAECWLAGVKARPSEPITVTVPPLLDSRSNDGAGVSHLAINTTVDATRVVTESTQQFEDQNPNENVCAQGNDAAIPASKDQSVELTTEVRVEVPQIAQNENVSLDKNNSSSAEHLSQNEPVLQNQHNSLAEVASLEPVDAVTTVQQSNGVLEEGELQVEDAAPTMKNQSTVNSETVPIVDPMPITEQPDGNLPVAENQNQHTSTEIQVEVSQPVDRSNNAMSGVELQNQEAPALENEGNLEVANSDLVDTVVLPTQPVIEQLYAEAPTAENQSTLNEVPISETVIHLQSNIEAPCNSEQRKNSVQIAEVAVTELLPDEPVPQNGDLDMRSIAHPQSAEVPTSSQNNVGISQTVDNAAERANEALLQEGINVNHHHHRSGYFLHPAAHQFPYFNPQSFVDPLQHELEKMTKEKDQFEKSHVDMVARVKSDCEKEIEEMTNQIRLKYQMKLQEAEAEFTMRKNEFEKNKNKMQTNMKLAEAFRYKCLDVRFPWPSGHQQGASSSGVYMQQMHQLATQPTLRIPAGASSSFQPSPSQLNPSSSIVQPVRSHPMRLSMATSHSVTAPSVQSLQQKHTSQALFPTPSSRPLPLISSITPSRNPRMPTGELRSPAPHLQSVSPAPHLQSFRPSPGPPVPPTTSLSPSQYRPVILPPAQPSQNGLGSGARGGLPAHPNRSTSAVALLMEMDRGSRALTNSASVPRGVSPTYVPLEGSELGVVGNVQGNQSSSAAANDVVCLSDDD